MAPNVKLKKDSTDSKLYDLKSHHYFKMNYFLRKNYIHIKQFQYK